MGFDELIKKLIYLDDLREDVARSPIYHSDMDELAVSIDRLIKKYELAIVEAGDYPTF